MNTLMEWKVNKFTTKSFLIFVKKDLDSKKLGLLQKDQWLRGVNESEKIIGRYKKSTEKFAKIQPRPKTRKIAGRPYNLLWSGDFFQKTKFQINVEEKDYKFIIDSYSSNKPKLFKTIKKYGLISEPNTIFGLTDKNEFKLIDEMETSFLNELNKILK